MFLYLTLYKCRERTLRRKTENGKLFAGAVIIPRIGLIKRKVQIRENLPCLMKFLHVKIFFDKNAFIFSREKCCF